MSPPAEGWILADRYRMHDRLGAGGAGEVFRATDERLRRSVAIKVFPAQTSADEATLRRELELRALASLSHPHLVTLFDAHVGQDSGPDFLVMELVEGPTLAARLHDGPMSDHEVRLLGAQLAEALAYVHSHGIVHRDVKPGNILLGSPGEDMRARLADFGVARELGDASLTAAGQVMGTACYMAPEQVRGEDVGPPSDIYALGLVLLEALTGQRSYDGPPIEAAIARLTNPPVVPAHLGAFWVGLLTAMTNADAAARPTAADLTRTLGNGLTQLDTATTAPIMPFAVAPVVAPSDPVMVIDEDVPPPRRRRGAFLLLAGGIAACAAGAIVAFALPSATTPPAGPTPSSDVRTSHHRVQHVSSQPVGVVAPAAQSSSSTHSSSKAVPSKRSSATSQPPPPTSSSAPASTSSSAPVTSSSVVPPPPPPTDSSSAAPNPSPAPPSVAG